MACAATTGRSVSDLGLGFASIELKSFPGLQKLVSDSLHHMLVANSLQLHYGLELTGFHWVVAGLRPAIGMRGGASDDQDPQPLALPAARADGAGDGAGVLRRGSPERPLRGPFHCANPGADGRRPAAWRSHAAPAATGRHGAVDRRVAARPVLIRAGTARSSTRAVSQEARTKGDDRRDLAVRHSASAADDGR